MSVITFPSALTAAKLSWSQVRRDSTYASPFGSQTVEISPPLWSAALSPPLMKEANSGAWQAFLMQLKGKTNQVALWNIGRPAPLGTMRGTMTLNTAIAQGDTSINIIASTEAGNTLVAGDYLGFGTGVTQQVIMITDTLVTANGSGIITANFEPPARNAITIGSSVTWDKPKVLFRCKNSPAQWDYSDGLLVSGFGLDLIESWQP